MAARGFGFHLGRRPLLCRSPAEDVHARELPLEHVLVRCGLLHHAAVRHVGTVNTFSSLSRGGWVLPVLPMRMESPASVSVAVPAHRYPARRRPRGTFLRGGMPCFRRTGTGRERRGRGSSAHKVTGARARRERGGHVRRAAGE